MYPADVDVTLRNAAANDLIRQTYDYDAFIELSALTFTQARLQIKNTFNNYTTSKLVLIAPTTPVTLLIGDSVTPDGTLQLKAMLYRNSTDPALDVTTTVQWITIPSPTAIVTVLNGLVTANSAGAIQIYAKVPGVGNLETTRLTITVA